MNTTLLNSHTKFGAKIFKPYRVITFLVLGHFLAAPWQLSQNAYGRKEPINDSENFKMSRNEKRVKFFFKFLSFTYRVVFIIIMISVFSTAFYAVESQFACVHCMYTVIFSHALAIIIVYYARRQHHTITICSKRLKLILKKAQYAQKHTQAENITSTQTPLTLQIHSIQPV